MPKISTDKLAKNIGIVVIAVIILLAVFWLTKTQINRRTPSISPASTPVNKIENFDPGTKPKQFPAQVPLEIGAKIISNYNATSPSGRVQATQVFESTKSVSANFKFYKDYLTRNKWKILAQDSSKPDLQLIVAESNNGILNVTIHKAKDPSKSVVDLSFLANQ